MYSANILATILTFRPIGTGNIKAKLWPLTDTSPNAPTGVFQYSLMGDPTLVVKLPTGYVGTIDLTYQLPDPRYLLIGIAFNPKKSHGDSGCREFPAISINRDPYGSQLTFIDACLPEFDKVVFNYVILVQEATTGLIGLIDPSEENDGGN